MYNLIQVLKSDDPIGYKVGYAGTTFLIASAAAYVTGKLLDRTGKAIEPTDNLDTSGLVKTRARVAKILQLSGKVLTRPVEFPIEQAIIGGKIIKGKIADGLFGSEEDEMHSIFGDLDVEPQEEDDGFRHSELGEMNMSFSQWADEAGFTIGKHKPTHEEFSDFFSKSKIIPINIREIFINMDESSKEELFKIFSQISQSSDMAQAEFQGMLLRRRKEITTAEQLVEISTSWMAERKVF